MAGPITHLDLPIFARVHGCHRAGDTAGAPCVFTSIRNGEGIAPIVEFVIKHGLLRAASPP